MLVYLSQALGEVNLDWPYRTWEGVAGAFLFFDAIWKYKIKQQD